MVLEGISIYSHDKLDNLGLIHTIYIATVILNLPRPNRRDMQVLQVQNLFK